MLTFANCERKITALNTISMKKFFLLCFTFFCLYFLFLTPSFAQDGCRTLEANSIFPFEKLPGGRDFENKLALILRESAHLRTEETFRIPVVIHVIHNGEAVGEGANISYAQIKSQIDVLNEDFNRKNADTVKIQDIFKPAAGRINIEFVLANFDPDGTPITSEPGVHRVRGIRSSWSNDKVFDAEVKPNTIWNPKKYLNIWTASFTGGLLGYAVFPQFSGVDGIPAEINPENREGVVISFDVFGSKKKFDAPQLIKKSFDRGRTATHEVGHFLGLLHTWGDGDCSVDDFCTDTPLASGKIFGCKKGSITCTDIDMTENFLTYSDDSCMNIFTKQQVERMKIILQNAPRRKELLSSDAANPIDKNLYARFFSDKKSLCIGQSVKFSENSVVLSGAGVQTRTWAFQGGSPAVSTEKNPTVSYSAAGKYKVSLTVTDGTTSSTITKEEFITVVAVSGSVNSLWKNFEDNILTSGNWLSDDFWATANFSPLDTGLYCAVFDNYTNKLNGNSKRLSSPYFFSGSADFWELNFDAAYGLRSNGSRDSLKISFSQDCGGTENVLWKKSGEDFAKVETDNFYRPKGSEWTREKLIFDNRSLKNSHLRFFFDNIGNYGNALYLDNIYLQKVNLSSKPEADFVADRSLLAPGDYAVFYDRSAGNAYNHLWNFSPANPSLSQSLQPKITYGITGTYPVALSVSNPLGNSSKSKNAYIRVTDLKNVKNYTQELKLIQDGAGYVCGTNSKNDQGKAEFFEKSTVSQQELLGADIDFAVLKAKTDNAVLTFKVWSGNQPSSIAATQTVRVRDMILRGNTYRLHLSAPISLPENYFIGVEFGNDIEIALFSSEENKNSAWERTSAGVWQPFDAPLSAGGRNLKRALAIKPLFQSDTPTGFENEDISEQIKLFPNPASYSFNIFSETLTIKKFDIIDISGKICGSGEANEQKVNFSCKNLAAGFYFVKVETNKGLTVKRLMIEN